MPKLTAISSVKQTFNPSKQPSLSLNSTANLVALHETETQTPAGTQETAENAHTQSFMGGDEFPWDPGP